MSIDSDSVGPTGRFVLCDLGWTLAGRKLLLLLLLLLLLRGWPHQASTEG